ncbi:MAG: efflux RND transporter permease subunit [Calditrichaeota bacterium]|nr:MAG: efflux RND transporter permease subunit [Calditrichota bacterium]
MNLVEFSLKHKPVVSILVLIFVVMGLMSYFSLPRESAPSITIPIVLVTTPYFGVSPSDIETLITQPIEKKLKELTDVKEIRSTSSEGMSVIEVEFNPDINIDEALQKVRDKVDLAKSELPEDAEEPVINEINFSEFPIMLVNISGNYDLVKLKEIAEDFEDKFEAIPGVLDVTISGGLEREVKVNVDLQKLKYYNVAFKDVIETIQNENKTIPGGSIEVGNLKYMVRVPGEFKTVDIIPDLVIKSENEKPIYIKDVADVEFGYKDPTSYARESGLNCVTLNVKKRSGENLLKIADQIKKIIEEEKPKLPSGTLITITADRSKDIRRMVNELENNIISGLILVVGILFAFLGFRNSLFVAIAIPLSMLIAFIVIQALGYTLNMIVLFSLILALGMLVDNAIVLVENIYRHREEGFSAYEASLKGAGEISRAITASTVTTLCAFAPMIIWPGIMGEFMKYLPITLIITLSSSLLVALAINPAVCEVFMKVTKKKEQHRILNRVLNSYEKVLRYALTHRRLTISASFGFLLFVIILYGFLGKGVEFFPEVEPSQLFIEVTAPTGTKLDESDRIVREIEKKIPKFKRDIVSYVSNVGNAGSNVRFGGGESSPHKSRVTIEFVERQYRSQSSELTMQQIRHEIEHIPGARIEVKKPDVGPPTGPPINIEIIGDDFEVLGQLATKIRNAIKHIPGLVDLKDDYDTGRPELKIRIDRKKAGIYGLTTAKIASTIRTAIYGTEASEYRVADEEYDITVRLKEDARKSLDALNNLTIYHEGKQIPLVAVASFEVGGGLTSIKRKDLKRVVTVSGNTEGRLTNDVLKDVQQTIAQMKLPPGYSIKYTGQNKEQEESKQFLIRAFMMAIFAIFLVLVYEFNSTSIPFVIMISVVLSLIGVLIGLLVTRLPFGILMTGIGVISLAGVVVNNAIVLIDYIQQLRERGMEKFEAIVQGGKTRLRPVIMTAITTIMGLIPLTTGFNFDFRNFRFDIGGESSQWWGPMGVAVIFGLAIATFLTLVVVPVAYYIFDSWSEKARIRFSFMFNGELEKSALETVDSVEK